MVFKNKRGRNWVRGGLAALVVVICSWSAVNGGGFLRSSNVGGIAISTNGLLKNAKVDDLKEWRKERLKALEPVPGGLKPFTPMRKVSLRKLEEAIQKHREEKFVPLPDHIRYLAGLQSIQYVFVYPEEKDIVLVGPGEGWTVDALGTVVGVTTGRPVLLLDDLLVALRSAEHARLHGILCSIDPTAEGLARLQQYLSGVDSIGNNPQQTLANIQEALGPQVVSVSGVAPDSHFARVLIAADFRMKRLGMKLDPAPIKGLPSFLDMLSGRGRGMSNMLPRWWLAPKAEPLLVSPDGLSFELRGIGIECKTENDLVNREGERKSTGKTGGVAEKWANLFTEKYDELSQVDSVFAQLRNLVDIAIVAALIEKDQLFARAGMEAPHLMAEEPFQTFNAAKKTETRVNFVKKGRTYLVSASGGVEIYPAHMAAETKKTEQLAPVRAECRDSGDNWWWN